MRIVDIDPVNYLNDTATKIGMYVSYYGLDIEEAQITWVLLTESESAVLYSKSYVPAYIVSSWNEDDMIVINEVLRINGFTLSTTTTTTTIQP